MTIYDYGEHFHVNLDFRKAGFSRQLSAIKRIFGAQYVKELKVWEVPGTARHAVGELAKTFGVFILDPFAPTPNFDDMPEMPDLAVELPINGNPRPYQGQGIARGHQLKRLIIGDEQGLGKTLEALGILLMAEAMGEDVFPCVVVCPSAAKENWKREIHKWSKKRAMILTDRTRPTWHKYWTVGMVDVFITNYESLKKYFVKSMPAKKDLEHSKQIIMQPAAECLRSIIIDESHRIKDGTTIQSKITTRLCLNKAYRLALSGTPVINRPIDLFPQLVALGQAHHFGGSQAAFKARYCAGEQGASNLKELNWLLNQHCFFRREKKDVAKDLPEKQRQKYICEISNRADYAFAEAEFRRWLVRAGQTDGQIERKMRAQALTKMMVLRQIAERGKIAEVKEFTDEILDAGEKLILFCTLRDTVARMKELYPHAVTITGDDDERAKQRSIDAFQTNPKVQLCLCNVVAAGVAITLTASSRVGFIGFPWTAAACLQCEDRAHRIGQRDNVMCTYFLADNTIDERSYDIIMEKKDIGNAITGATDEMEMAVVDRLLTLFNDPKKKTSHEQQTSTADHLLDAPAAGDVLRQPDAPAGHSRPHAHPPSELF